MLQAVLTLAALAAPADSTPAVQGERLRLSPDPVVVVVQTPRTVPFAFAVAIRTMRPAPVDTGRPISFSYSDGYELRQTIHQTASYALLPLFAIQFAAGSQIFDKSTEAPAWAKAVHGPAATGVAALFAVNTVTGVWNLWEARPDPEGRVRRTAHGLLMLASDAGFTYTGILAEQAERSPDKRRLHRQVALTSIGVATASYLLMALPFWE